MAPAGIAGAAVVLGVDRLREDDRPLAAQLLDQDVVARREVDVVGGVATGGGPHVLRVERILEGKDDAIHRHLVERWIGTVRGVKLGGAFQRIGIVPEYLAERRSDWLPRAFPR